MDWRDVKECCITTKIIFHCVYGAWNFFFFSVLAFESKNVASRTSRAFEIWKLKFEIQITCDFEHFLGPTICEIVPD